MKTVIMSSIFVVLASLGGVFLPGCAGFKAAQQAYEQSVDDAEKIAEQGKKLAEEIKLIYADIDRIYDEYQLATKNGDTTKAAALLKAGQDALRLVANKKLLLVEAEKAFEMAKDFVSKARKRAEDAKSSEEYIGNIFGTIMAAVGSIFGVGGLAVGVNQRGKATAERKDYEVLASAAKKTASNVDAFVPEDKWPAFLAAQNASMTAAEIAEMDYARKGT
jgi:hypothetical protein